MAYRKISERFWLSARIARLSDDAKLLYLYLLTCPHNNALTVYRLPIGYAMADLKWAEERLRERLRELLAQPFEDGSPGLIAWDEDRSLITVKGQIEIDGLINPNAVKAAISQLDKIPKGSHIYQVIIDTLERLDKPLTEPLRERLWEWLGEPLREPLRELQEQEQEQEIEEVPKKVPRSACFDFKIPAGWEVIPDDLIQPLHDLCERLSKPPGGRGGKAVFPRAYQFVNAMQKEAVLAEAISEGLNALEKYPKPRNGPWPYARDVAIKESQNIREARARAEHEKVKAENPIKGLFDKGSD